MKTFKLQIAVPDGVVFDGDATQLSVRGIGGDGTIKQGHADGGMLMVSNECVRVMALRFSWKD